MCQTRCPSGSRVFVLQVRSVSDGRRTERRRTDRAIEVDGQRLSVGGGLYNEECGLPNDASIEFVSFVRWPPSGSAECCVRRST
jgi:hypothetical protein